MAADIAALRTQCEVLVVALHKGLGHVPAQIEWYETQVSRAAIDAGADAVIGHHAHILRGIELYRGRPIFHGLGNFVSVTRALNIEGNASPERLAWARKRQQLFGFVPDPAMPTYPFHPDSRHTMVACLSWRREGSGPSGTASGVFEAGYIPCWIDAQARPTPLERAAAADTVAYVQRIGEQAGLNTRHEWHTDPRLGELVRVLPATSVQGARA